MLVLGIDPGLAITGFGLVCTTERNEYACVDYGVLRTASNLPDAQRLRKLYDELKELINQHHPDSSAVEKLFFQKNVKTAFAIGRAQAIAILAAADRGVPYHEYSPAQVKQRVANYGASSKSRSRKWSGFSWDLPKPRAPAMPLTLWR